MPNPLQGLPRPRRSIRSPSSPKRDLGLVEFTCCRSDLWCIYAHVVVGKESPGSSVARASVLSSSTCHDRLAGHGRRCRRRHGALGRWWLGNVLGVEAFAALENRPDDACVLVGRGHHAFCPPECRASACSPREMGSLRWCAALSTDFAPGISSIRRAGPSLERSRCGKPRGPVRPMARSARRGSSGAR